MANCAIAGADRCRFASEELALTTWVEFFEAHKNFLNCPASKPSLSYSERGFCSSTCVQLFVSWCQLGQDAPEGSVYLMSRRLTWHTEAHGEANDQDGGQPE